MKPGISIGFLLFVQCFAHGKNVIVFLADNLGYEDISYFAKASSKTTPHIDGLAQRGLVWSHWNSAAHLCSASRAALLTGQYPVRNGIFPGVFHRDAVHGLPRSTQTLASYLSSQNYSTAIVGKWHLGQRPQYLPTHYGFDDWLGVPYHMSGGSVDQHICAYDTNSTTWLPLYRGDRIIQQPVDLTRLAQNYADFAVDYIHRQARANKPFFLYVPFSHVHQLCAPRDFDEGSTCQWTRSGPNQTFTSAVREMDWIAGQIIQALDNTNLTNETFIWFTSDNGPWVAEQSCSGSKGPFHGQWLIDNVSPDCTACPHDYTPVNDADQPRSHTCTLGRHKLQGVPCGYDSGLGSLWEANLRMPSILVGPGVPSNVVSEHTASTMDILPTTLSLLDFDIPSKLDGVDLSPTIERPEISGSEERVLYFWRDGFGEGPLPAPYGRMDVAAVKVGFLKFWFWTKSSHYNDDPAVVHDPPLVFDVLKDPAEAYPLSPSEYDEKMLSKVKELVRLHKESVGWTYPLALERDGRFTPCVDASTNCRTNISMSVEVSV